MNTTPEWRHTHKISIAKGVFKFLYLLLIPVARGFVSAIKGGGIIHGFTLWLKGAWFDVLVISVILLLGFLQWYLILYVYNEDGITIRKGIFIKRYSHIPYKKVLALSIVKPFYLKPFGAVQLRADTPAGSFKKADCILTVTKDEARRIMGMRLEEDSGLISRIYTPDNMRIILLSLITSNSLAGIIFIATLINQSGQILGEEFSNRIYGTFERITKIIAFGAPPAASFIAYLLFFGWLMNCAVNVIRHKNFTVRRDDDSLHIKSGIFTNRIYDLYNKSICYVDIRQSVLTKILGVYSIYIYAIGYGKDKTDVSVLVPAVTKKELESILELLLPEFKITKRELKPNLGSIFKFIIEPLWACTLIPLGAWLIGYIYPTWTQLIYFLGFMALVPAVWFMIVRLMDFASSGISKGDNTYTLRYSSGYYLHTVIIPKKKITILNIRQSILQRGDNRCDVVIYSYSELIKRHHCKNLDRTKVMEIFDTI